MQLRSLLATAVACSAIATIAPIASAVAEPTVVNAVASTCTVAKVPGLTGATKVRTTGVNLPAVFLDETGCDSAYDIVKQAAVKQMPFSEHGYDCTPSLVSARIGQWTCTFAAATAPAKLRLRFTARYAK
jgi:hypothetical protein